MTYGGEDNDGCIYGCGIIQRRLGCALLRWCCRIYNRKRCAFVTCLDNGIEVLVGADNRYATFCLSFDDMRCCSVHITLVEQTSLYLVA